MIPAIILSDFPENQYPIEGHHLITSFPHNLIALFTCPSSHVSRPSRPSSLVLRPLSLVPRPSIKKRPIDPEMPGKIIHRIAGHMVIAVTQPTRIDVRELHKHPQLLYTQIQESINKGVIAHLLIIL